MGGGAFLQEVDPPWTPVWPLLQLTDPTELWLSVVGIRSWYQSHGTLGSVLPVTCYTSFELVLVFLLCRLVLLFFSFLIEVYLFPFAMFFVPFSFLFVLDLSFPRFA